MTAKDRSHGLKWIVYGGLIAMVAIVARTQMTAQEATVPAPLPANAAAPEISISADIAHRSKAEDGSQVSVLRGNCRIEQADTIVTARQAIIWESKIGNRHRVEVYLEDEVRIETPSSSQQYQQTYLQLWSDVGVNFQARWPREYQAPLSDPLLQRGMSRRKVHFEQVSQPLNALQLPLDSAAFQSLTLQPPSTALRRVRVSSRTGTPFSVRTERSTTSTPAEQIAVLSGGVKLNIDAPTADGRPDPNAIEFAADSMVVWTEPTDIENLAQGAERFQSREAPLQIYLEGNIVVRQDNTVLKASRAFYDARDNRALMTDAELKVSLSNSDVPLRVRASRIRQLGEKSFHAQNAWMTGSKFGKPGYRIESRDIFYEQRVINPLVHANGGWIDPQTGEFDDGVANWVTTLDNRLYLEDMPVGFIPYFSGPAEDPHIPIRKASVRSDRVFGTSVQTVWDPFHALSIDKPRGFDMGVLLDAYSRRGIGLGLEGSYKREDLFGIDDKYSGEFVPYYVHDDATDNLGMDRRSVKFDDSNRGRLFWRHRHELPHDIFVNAELGWISDRNFLEQYYENEFDRDKDNESLLYVQQNFDTNWSGAILGRPQVNDFENDTQWLPKGDLYGLNEPLLDGLLTWTSHSSMGYGKISRADAPFDPNEAFSPLPYYSSVEGGVFMTRHELTAPFNLGPVIISPYLRGEAAYWNEDLTGQHADRFVGTGGVHASLTMWRVWPYIRNSIFNLNGLAHKMVFDFDWSYTEATRDFSSIAQFNEFDDNAQERLRQRIVTNTFGGALPNILEPRRYAIRAGAGELVSVPYHELVNDLQVLRLGWHHRLQTKVGPPDRQRIRDWMTLDLGAAYFPRSQRDNFGEDFGLLSARYSWLMSDRVTLLAGATYDTFDGGQELWHVGFLTQRPERGSFYLGYRNVRAKDIDSQILTSSVSYLLNPKWIITASTAYDVGENQNRGQSLTLTRAGADWLFHLGGSFDSSKDSYGIAVSFEPRFGARDASSTQLSSLLGINR